MAVSKIRIKAVASSDDAVIAWRYPAVIKNCRGFAILRQRKGESEAASEWVKSSVGWEDQAHDDFETHDTTMWPVQRYLWTDYFVKSGDTIRYKVIPMIWNGKDIEKDETKASPWSNWAEVDEDSSEAYFNRGIVSSQFVAKRLMDIPQKDRSKTLKENLTDPKSPLRTFMGGTLLGAIYGILEEPLAEGNKDVHLFAALYELDDVVLISKLNKLGKRAHVILANGAFGNDDHDPQKEHAEQIAKTDLTRRIVGSPHFAHNKFVVLAKKVGKTFVPFKTLTGSTNWTRNGLFTQVNNALILDDKDVAAYYLEEWNAIKEDCDESGKGLYAKKFKELNSTCHKAKDITTWFTPTVKQADNNDAMERINKAKDGILFLMFKPGDEKSAVLYNAARARAAGEKPIMVHGIMNTDPGGSKNPTIEFINKGKVQKGDLSIVTPDNIKKEFGFWEQEVAKPAVTIHSKTIVIDPFGKNPVVITGSHNMGKKASASNDDNLNIIENNPELAQAYAVHIMSVYHHYRWRFYRARAGEGTKTKKLWTGLVRNDEWQQWYRTGGNKMELDFWIK